MSIQPTPNSVPDFPDAVLVDYLLDRVDQNMRARIAEQRKIIGSPVQKWFANVSRRLENPLAVDWLAMTDPDLNREEQSDGK